MKRHAGTRRQLKDANCHGGIVMDVQVSDGPSASPQETLRFSNTAVPFVPCSTFSDLQCVDASLSCTLLHAEA